MSLNKNISQLFVFAVLISCELLLTLVIGMALELYKQASEFEGSTKDQFQSNSFGNLIFLSNLTIIIIGISGILVIWISCPCTDHLKKKLAPDVKNLKIKTQPCWGRLYNAVVRCLRTELCCAYGKSLSMVTLNSNVENQKCGNLWDGKKQPEDNEGNQNHHAIIQGHIEKTRDQKSDFEQMHLKQRSKFKRKLKQRLTKSRLFKSTREREKMKKLGVLQKNELFSKLKKSSILEILKFMEFSEYQCDDNLCEEKEVADRLFVLVSGAVQVIKSVGEDDTEIIRVYKALDDYPIFGESSILEEGTTIRNATLQATADCTTMELSKLLYFKLMSTGNLMQKDSRNVDLDHSLRRQSSAFHTADLARMQKLKELRDALEPREEGKN